jgi:predicted SAM-dependent methyltransferase
MNITELQPILQSPITGAGCTKVSDTFLAFGNEQFPLVDGIPVLIDEVNSVFSTGDIVTNKVTTQSSDYNNTSTSLKNKLRRSILPQITKDYHFNKRYIDLAQNTAGKTILIIGAGHKSSLYHEIFKGANLIISDVHIQFDVDIVIDANKLPFKNDSIDLIIAGQVMEHTIRPWLVAAEMERVVKPNGQIHIESPMCFSFHANPYDFYRFTFMGMRSLYPHSKIKKAFITEAGGNTLGFVSAEVLINSFTGKYARRAATLFSRFAFGWFKWFDKFKSIESKKLTRWMVPMGIGMTFICDKRKRNDKEIMNDYYDYFQLTK